MGEEGGVYALRKTRDDAPMEPPATLHSVPEAERARLATAWAAAHYFVTVGREEWLFCVGMTAPDVERQLMAERYLFITAWNPPPGESPRAFNDEAHLRLQRRIEALGFDYHPSLGCNNQGGMVEHGWCVLDPTEAQADALALEFGQGGTLLWRAGEPVRLRMMWPRPPQADDEPHTDWMG